MVSSDKKLEMLRQIRTENMENRMKLRSRESFLYGGMPTDHGSAIPEERFPLLAGSGWHSREWEQQLGMDGAVREQAPPSTFRLRLVIALFLLGAFFYLSKTQVQLFGYDSKQLTARITSNIQADAGINVFDFISQLPYTKENE